MSRSTRTAARAAAPPDEEPEPDVAVAPRSSVQGLGKMSDYVKKPFDGKNPADYQDFIDSFELGVSTLETAQEKQYLVLLSLQSTLGLLQGGLQLLLLSLQTAPLLVQLVDGAASVSQLVQQILDLVSQVLVLAADNVQLLIGLIKSGLQAEPLGVEVAAL